MTKSEFFNAGYITKTSGFSGDLILLFDVDDIQRYKQLNTLYIELKDTLKEYKLDNYVLNNNSTATFHIQGIDDFEQAKELVKKKVYLPLSFLPPLTGNNFYFHEIIGFNVIDKQYGDIGIADSVVEMLHQNILQVKKQGKEILIPLKDEFIELVDRAAKKLYINAPDGLIDIYLRPSNSQDDEEMEFNFDSSD